MAAIYDMASGWPITEGLQGCYVCDQAIDMAQEIADEREECVLLDDDDGQWVVHPMRDGVREPADRYEPE